MTRVLKVLELFAGVGGFRIGLEEANSDRFLTKWSNQWEPSTRSQDAFEVYDYKFPDSHNINQDISTISDEVFEKIDADMIVGGFPCQDYSVARSKSGELGIEGKKGVLFWEIVRVTQIINPKYLLLENVDRLLKSPSKQRGRDFAIMLGALNKLGYSVEWRVINAADYGRAQRRRRVFIFAYRNDLTWAINLDKKYEHRQQVNLFGEKIAYPETYKQYIFEEGLFATMFPVDSTPYKNRANAYSLDKDLVNISNMFSGRIWNAGVMRHSILYTYDLTPIKETPIPLKDILQSASEVPNNYYLTEKQIEKIAYLRGPKKIKRKAASGHEYVYSEGGMRPTDDLDLPARTMLTSEGSINRSSHIIETDQGLRFITPVEAERIQDFPDDWTRYKKSEDGELVQVSDKTRLFFMGNALVTGIIKRIAKGIEKIDDINS